MTRTTCKIKHLVWGSQLQRVRVHDRQEVKQGDRHGAGAVAAYSLFYENKAEMFVSRNGGLLRPQSLPQ